MGTETINENPVPMLLMKIAGMNSEYLRPSRTLPFAIALNR